MVENSKPYGFLAIPSGPHVYRNRPRTDSRLNSGFHGKHHNLDFLGTNSQLRAFPQQYNTAWDVPYTSPQTRSPPHFQDCQYTRQGVHHQALSKTQKNSSDGATTRWPCPPGKKFPRELQPPKASPQPQPHIRDNLHRNTSAIQAPSAQTESRQKSAKSFQEQSWHAVQFPKRSRCDGRRNPARKSSQSYCCYKNWHRRNLQNASCRIPSLPTFCPSDGLPKGQEAFCFSSPSTGPFFRL